MRQPGRADGVWRATVHDVAREANVSTATVSRALRFPEQVSPQLVSRVSQAVAKLGYVPSATARALSTLHTGSVALIVSDLARYAVVASVVVARLAAFGMAVRVEECVATKAGPIIERVTRDEVEAILLVGLPEDAMESDELASRRIAHVGVGVTAAGSLGVHLDLSTAAATTLGHLAALGHRRLALVSAGNADWLGAAWLAALRAGSEDLGIELAFVSPAQWMMAAEPVKAAICDSDLAAAEVMARATARGVDVPTGLSCVGWGDEPFAARLAPSLTTVRLPQRVLGHRLVDALLAARAGTAVKTVRIVPKLVIRRSTAAIDVSRGTTGPGST